MRLALVTETYPPEINGVAMTLQRLVQGMTARGHHVQLIRPRQHPADAPALVVGVEHHTVPGIALPRYQGLHMGLPCARRLKRLWRATRPDVVHIATEGPLGFSALRVARRLGVPMTSSFHTNFHSYGRHYGYGFLYRPVTAYLRWVHNATHRTMVPSADIARALESTGFRNLTVIGRGVDTQLFDPARRSSELRRSWGTDDDTLVALYVGRVAAEKNVPLSLRAFQALRETQPRAKMVVVGGGPMLESLRQAHPHVVFTGPVRPDQLAVCYASADVFLFASVTETFGNVVTEAMASGLAVAGFNYAAAQQHIRHEHNGLVAPMHDESAFLDLARRLGHDPALARRLGANARATTLPLSWRGIIDQFEQMVADAAIH